MRYSPLVSVIICTKDRIESLEKLALKSLFKTRYPNYEIIIVDDASKKDTSKILSKYSHKMTIVKNSRSRGLCYARNLGIRHAKGDIIAFMDDDCIAEKDWLNELVKPYVKNPKIMVVGGRILTGDSKIIQNKERQIYGCNMSFRRKVFEKHLFDTNLYFNKYHWYDETELLYRLKKKNMKIVYNESAVVRHFTKPAEYRKNMELGKPMNLAYMYAKRIPIAKYYTLFFVNLLFGISKESSSNADTKELITVFDWARGSISLKNHKISYLPWIYYNLLFEIPLKAKIKSKAEKRKISL